jgi:hypothetical protein
MEQDVIAISTLMDQIFKMLSRISDPCVPLPLPLSTLILLISGFGIKPWTSTIPRALSKKTADIVPSSTSASRRPTVPSARHYPFGMAHPLIALTIPTLHLGALAKTYWISTTSQ